MLKTVLFSDQAREAIGELCSFRLQQTYLKMCQSKMRGRT